MAKKKLKRNITGLRNQSARGSKFYKRKAVDDWVEEVNGRLVIKNAEGVVIKEARKIIYPGSNGDPYWDCDQLIEQVKTKAIPVFEEAQV